MTEAYAMISSKFDPDTPNYTEALTGENSE